MANFCTKCGKQAKPGIKFCTSCGGQLKAKPAPPPVAPPPVAVPPPPPPSRGSGCSGCAIGCLVAILIIVLLLAGLIGGGYYFLSKLKKAEPGDYFEVDSKGTPVSCGDSLTCIDSKLKVCASAEGETELGEFADVEFEVVGKSGTSCVIFAKIVNIRELPAGMDVIPDFILKTMFKDLSLECLVPQNIYTQGMEKVGEYIGDNMVDICKGPLFDAAEKFGVDLEDLK